MQFKLLIGTNNHGKVREYSRLLNDLPIVFTTPEQEGITGEPNETGDSFLENALIKAQYYSSETGLPTLSDDSGLEVDALDGAPGIYSARYAGVAATDNENNDLLLNNLSETPWEGRTARFRCVIALVISGNESELFEGTCDGYVTRQINGINGFGYDPLFYYPGFGKTFGEIDHDSKDAVSHRGIATNKLYKRLKCLLTRDSTE
ncbi:MAG: RdgB/HAM1 family non-canonical purine NTP pyrophosphatase [Anaerolineales bacterium]|nr:RdgB/HAM1 family non-canonical purine NTP pyrophosphatase [Anaerolineales bacterium]